MCSQPSKPNAVGYGQAFTQSIIDTAGKDATPRMKQIMLSLIQHLHDFARDVDLTAEEWVEGVRFVRWTGDLDDALDRPGGLLTDNLTDEPVWSNVL